MALTMNLTNVQREAPTFKTETGEIVTLTDAKGEQYFRELQTTIKPVQDLHGYDYPWPAGGGKNKLPITIDSITQNTGRTWTNNSTTVNGITFTLLTDSSNNLTGINANGTATGEVTLFLVGKGWGYSNSVKDIFDKEVTYTLEDGKGNNDPNAKVEISIYHSDGTSTGKAPASSSGSGNSNRTFTVLNEDNLGYLAYIRISNGTTVNNVVFKPMVTIGSAIDATFAPYENDCPISGWSEAKIYVQQTVDPTANPTAIIALDGTRYGCVLDVRRGKLIVDRVIYVFTGNESPYVQAGQNRIAVNIGITTKPGSAICSDFAEVVTANNLTYVYIPTSMTVDELKDYMANHTVQCVYLIAQPIEVDVDPEAIKTVDGINNIWADCGDIEVTYKVE